MSKVYSLGMYHNVHPANVGMFCATEMSKSTYAEISTGEEVFIVMMYRLSDNANGKPDMYSISRENPIYRDWSVHKGCIQDVLTAFLIVGAVITVK